MSACLATAHCRQHDAGTVLARFARCSRACTPPALHPSLPHPILLPAAIAHTFPVDRDSPAAPCERPASDSPARGTRWPPRLKRKVSSVLVVSAALMNSNNQVRRAALCVLRCACCGMVCVLRVLWCAALCVLWYGVLRCAVQWCNWCGELCRACVSSKTPPAAPPRACMRLLGCACCCRIFCR